MMKTVVLVSLLVLGGKTFAAAPAVDCSQAAKGKISIKVEGERLADEKIAPLAYACFSKQIVSIANARKLAIKKSQDDATHPSQCGQPGELQTLELASWKGGRPSMSSNENGDTMATVGGNATLLVREPITCSGVGTGLYDGTNAAVTISMEIEEWFTFKMEDENAPGTQTIEVTFKKLHNL